MSNCIVCNSVIESNRKGKKYCSVKCKQRAYHARKNGNTLSPQVIKEPHYSYKEYKEFYSSLTKHFDISYLEYCYIRSVLPVIEDKSEILEMVEDVLYDAHKDDSSSYLIYLTGFENYKKKLFQKSLSTLD